MSNHTANYIAALQKENATGVAIEHAYRPALKNYLEALLPNIIAINDPKRQKCGAPDYIVRKGELDVGYIEAKDINVGLDKVEKTDQMKRYLESLDNLILTDYLEFRFYRDGKKVDSVRIAELGAFFQIDKPQIKALPENFEKLETLLADFIGFQGQTIKSPKQLAEMMARKAKLMRDVFAKALAEEDEDNSLRDQWSAFKQILIHDMDAAQFADVYAQTITYGLFTARLHDQTLQDFSREEARGLIPRSNPFVRQLFDYVCGANLDTRVVWIVDALCEVYRAADVHAILHKFGKATGRNDPIVHFYEDFLGEYDKKLKKSRGVWYTPEPVVNFIVRAVDEVLKTHFKLPDGLADTSKVTIEVDDQHITRRGAAKKKIDVHRVQLLDVAAGTGTFTAEAIKQIYSRFAGQEGMWSSYVEEHLLPRLHGFEILMASYAMCHLKIDLLLQETGYKPKNPNNPPRLGVYLTNALEEHHPDVGTLFASWLAKEANEASRIKKDIPIMVAYGNPPYSGHSANKGEWIEKLLENYKKEPTGGKLKERNPKWLNDDYVKFIRLAEHYVERNRHGVLAYITNHGYLDNPTFRGMRWHLLNTFDDIYILDLHGNAKKKEVSPDGSADKNVFDIQQGVAIIVAVKHGSRRERLAQVHHADLWGERKGKYERLWDGILASVGFVTLATAAPNYLFVPKNTDAEAIYQQGFAVNALFSINSVGIVTSRDDFVIDSDKVALQKRIQDFIAVPNAETAKQLFSLRENQSFNVEKVKAQAVYVSDAVVPVSYRPFDNRFLYYDDIFVERSRREVMRHFLAGDNLGLCFLRQVKTGNSWHHLFVSRTIIDSTLVSNRTSEITYSLPLYLYPDASAVQTDLDLSTPHPNPLPQGEREVVPHPAALRQGEREVAPHPAALRQGEREVVPHPATLRQGEREAATHPATLRQGEREVATHPSPLPQGEREVVPHPAALRQGERKLSRKPNLDEKIVAEIAKKLGLDFVPDHDPAYLPTEKTPNHTECRQNISGDTKTPSPLGGEGRGEGSNYAPNHRPYPDYLKTFARSMRRDATSAESIIWEMVRDRRMGVKFRRQHPMGSRYIADFACPEKKLVVEIDGGQHAESHSDASRTAFLEAEGFRVLRFWNDEVMKNPEGCYMTLQEALSCEEGEITPHPSPLPQGEREAAPNDSSNNKKFFTPLDLLDYIYAVLHSPNYRRTYKEFLKIDFPRIPYPTDAASFWQLVALGGELRALHLLEHPVLAKPITTYPVSGDNMVEKPLFSVIATQSEAKGKQSSEKMDSRLRGNDEGVLGRVYINKEQYFGNVPEVAWNFYIGGYQPAQKWLKDRKGRNLSLDDLRHYAKIIIALLETDRLMKAIDAVR